MLTYITSAKLRLHVFIWCCFILNEILAARSMSGTFRPLLNYLFFYTVNISLFYLNAKVVLPFAFTAQRTAPWKVPLLVGLEILAFIVITYFGSILLHTLPQTKFDKTVVFWSLWRCIYFLGFSTGYYFLNAYLRSQLAKEAAEKTVLKQLLQEKQSAMELSEAKNAYLQAQINPHFLFNALNFIYNRSRKADPMIARAIMLLSHIMRFSVETEQRERKIHIFEEIKQIEHLIELWQIKQQDKLFLTIHCSEEARKLSFIPHVLLTLTENMLKHGELCDPEFPAIISIWTEQHQLTIETRNATANSKTVVGFGSGLANVKQRLLYTYGKEASLLYGEKDQNYFVVNIFVDVSISIDF